MSQSDMNHSRGLIDVEFTIERGANPQAILNCRLAE